VIAHRLPQNPIIAPNMDERMGGNVNGPSLIRVPAWLEVPLGWYYLYFAHHKGQYIRLAVADQIEGPYRTYAPGTLSLAQTPCRGHIASPDVHVDHAQRRLIMYYHGPVDPEQATANGGPLPGGQCSFVATSRDGIHFTSRSEVLGKPYMRAWQWQGAVYALGMPGVFYRSADGLTGFERGPTLFTADMRHAAVWLDGNRLHVVYSNAHDCPEHILVSTIDLTPDWTSWRASAPRSLLEPETAYEGVHLPLVPSTRGWAPEPVRQTRDPGIYCEGGRTYLLYSVAGEQGIAMAEIVRGTEARRG
jgi:hypothetical protein